MENADKVMTRGPLQSDTGEEQNGSLFLYGDLLVLTNVRYGSAAAILANPE